MVVLGGVAVSCERGTPVGPRAHPPEGTAGPEDRVLDGPASGEKGSKGRN